MLPVRLGTCLTRGSPQVLVKLSRPLHHRTSPDVPPSIFTLSDVAITKSTSELLDDHQIQQEGGPKHPLKKSYSNPEVPARQIDVSRQKIVSPLSRGNF